MECTATDADIYTKLNVWLNFVTICLASNATSFTIIFQKLLLKEIIFYKDIPSQVWPLPLKYEIKIEVR